MELACGYLAEAMHLPLTIPLEVVTTRLQKGGASASVSATLRSVVADSGVSALWTGWRAYVFLCTQPMLQFIGFERLKKLWLAGGGASQLSAWQAFWLGALARAIAVCLTFPFTRARTILQARAKAPSTKAADDSAKPALPESVLPLLLHVVATDGFWSLYRGFGPELLRGVGVGWRQEGMGTVARSCNAF